MKKFNAFLVIITGPLSAITQVMPMDHKSHSVSVTAFEEEHSQPKTSLIRTRHNSLSPPLRRGRRQEETECIDYKVDTVKGIKDWHDSYDGSDQYNCKWYGKRAFRCANAGDKFENYGKTANEACCACGGGSTSTPKRGRNNDRSIAEEWVNQHNKRCKKYQEMYGYKYTPVDWDPILAKSAQKYANYLVDTALSADEFANNCHLYHVRDGFRGGENLAANPGGKSNSIDNVLYRWVEKEHDGDDDRIGIQMQRRNKPAGNMDFIIHGHFTQVVWSATTKIGCAEATKKGNICTVQVCRYSKPGNCDICARGQSCSPKNIPAKQWQKKTFAESSPCTIPKQWWEQNK